METHIHIRLVVAGRDDREKLQEIAWSLVPLNPSRKPAGTFAPSLLSIHTVNSRPCLLKNILMVSLNNKDLDSLAKSTQLVISTVGLFQLYGSDTFARCARNGTHYLDR
ncbi:hypothetical protein BJX65DRAFT_276603 [Aspergillus insuetus]